MKKFLMISGGFILSEKQFVVSSTQLIAILLDVLGLILNLVGASIARVRPGSGLGVGLYWLGFVLLIVALIAFIWGLRKTTVTKTVAATMNTT